MARPFSVGVVNYGIGNVGSVLGAFEFCGCPARVVERPSELARFDALVLCGVGHFSMAVSRLDASRLREPLNEQVLGRGKPVLGICLGMQLFADYGHEGGRTRGLGWIKGEVRRLPEGGAKVPHIGWDPVLPKDRSMFRRVRYHEFYFMHSYHFVPKERSVVAGVTTYDGVEVVSAVRRGRVFGVQFHPEKSQGDGLRVLSNFIEAARGE
ncbi:MAG: imidazole glycerol phosphate synthase subunit HisH [Elusimicrobiota bacterium]